MNKANGKHPIPLVDDRWFHKIVWQCIKCGWEYEMKKASDPHPTDCEFCKRMNETMAKTPARFNPTVMPKVEESDD